VPLVSLFFRGFFLPTLLFAWVRGVSYGPTTHVRRST
jgi:hypothetical protein